MTMTDFSETLSTTATELISTKIAVVVREDLASWQKLNVTAFVSSGVAASQPAVIGQPYSDASGTAYLAIFGQPVLVFAADGDSLRRAFGRAVQRGVPSAVFTHDMFSTGNDADNRRVVASVGFDELDVVGFGLIADRKVVDKICKGIRLHG
ncbi:MAG: DUF2000 family protein [Mycobacteriales bacterium]